MKKGLPAALGLALALLSGCAARATGEDAPPLCWPEQPVTLYVSSDLHWQPRAQAAGNDLLPEMVWLEEIIDALMDAAARDKPAALVLCGDLTNGGTLEEHEALSARLGAAEAAGVNIFVTMGNHDMDRSVPPGTLKRLYGAFGWAEALSADGGSMSYLAPVTDGLWLLSLDCNVYGEKESKLAGTVSTETLAWVEDCLERAAEAGVMVVPFSHHNLMVHTVDGDGRNYNIDGGDALEDLLLSYGVPLYLSGHRHNSFLVEAERDGRKLIEAVTDMPAAYPHRYTAITLQPDGTADYAVPSLDVDGWAARTGRSERELLRFAEQSGARARARLEDTAARVTERMDAAQADRAEMERFYLDFYACYQARTLWREGDRLRADPGLALWRAHAGENIYARWMPWILEHQSADAPVQTLGPFR